MTKTEVVKDISKTAFLGATWIGGFVLTIMGIRYGWNWLCQSGNDIYLWYFGAGLLTLIICTIFGYFIRSMRGDFESTSSSSSYDHGW